MRSHPSHFLTGADMRWKFSISIETTGAAQASELIFRCHAGATAKSANQTKLVDQKKKQFRFL